MTMGVAMATDGGPDEEKTDRARGEGAGCAREGSGGWVGLFDAERLNLTWSGVDPSVGAGYIPGNLLAERVAEMVRKELLPRLRNASPFDGVEAHADMDGNAYLWLRLGAVGMAELLEAAAIGFRLRPGSGD